MINAIILLNTALDSQDFALEKIKLLDGVEEAHTLYGVYDLLVKVNAPSIDKLKTITKTQIKQVTGVTSALTLMINDPDRKLG
jgi:DNA-binding Lrp family transcriptional regulator